jgi:hypothetical protein
MVPLLSTSAASMSLVPDIGISLSLRLELCLLEPLLELVKED